MFYVTMLQNFVTVSNEFWHVFGRSVSVNFSVGLDSVSLDRFVQIRVVLAERTSTLVNCTLLAYVEL